MGCWFFFFFVFFFGKSAFQKWTYPMINYHKPMKNLSPGLEVDVWRVYKYIRIDSMRKTEIINCLASSPIRPSSGHISHKNHFLIPEKKAGHLSTCDFVTHWDQFKMICRMICPQPMTMSPYKIYFGRPMSSKKHRKSGITSMKNNKQRHSEFFISLWKRETLTRGDQIVIKTIFCAVFPFSETPFFFRTTTKFLHR